MRVPKGFVYFSFCKRQIKSKTTCHKTFDLKKNYKKKKTKKTFDLKNLPRGKKINFVLSLPI